MTTTTPEPMVSAQPQPSTAVIPWNLAVLVLDNIYWGWGQFNRMVTIPIKEAMRFYRETSRIDLRPTFVPFNDPHGYSGPNSNGDYGLYWSVLPQKWIDQIPANSNSVLVLYKLDTDIKRNPFQVGSTWHLRDGIVIPGGKRVTFSSIPVDDANGDRFPWNVNTEYQGFTTRRGQIIVHETVNGISGTLENAPYCPPCHRLDGVPGAPAWEYESGRMSQIGADCYAKLAKS